MGDMTGQDAERLHALITRHAHYTNSAKAKTILARLAGVAEEVPQGDAGRVSPGAGRDGEAPGGAGTGLDVLEIGVPKAKGKARAAE